jgi:hypothetical protein
MSMTCCWEYDCVRLDEMHAKDCMKRATMFRPRKGIMKKPHMMNIFRMTWNSMELEPVMCCWITSNYIDEFW